MRKLKAYVNMDEYNKVHYYKDFIIEEARYQVGDIYEHEEIKEIEQIKPDVENNLDVFSYDLFKIITTMNKEYDEDTYDVYYIAVRKEDAPE